MADLNYKLFFKRPSTAAVAYIVAVVAFCSITIASSFAIIEQFARRNETIEELRSLEARAGASKHAGISAKAPFLSGDFATIASAELLQRVTSAITKANGKVLSSEPDELLPHSKSKEMKATTNFEINQHDLQGLLFELEFGFPLLTVDQLTIDAEKTTSSFIRLRVVMQVSGSWRGQQ